jgi:hypothetical protein
MQDAYNGKQLEIKYFFPLTEQVALDLDYTDCDKPKLYYTIANGGTSGQVLTAGTGLTFAEPTWKTVISGWEVGSLNYKPNRVHKFFMKLLLGWKWNG